MFLTSMRTSWLWLQYSFNTTLHYSRNIIMMSFMSWISYVVLTFILHHVRSNIFMKLFSKLPLKLELKFKIWEHTNEMNLVYICLQGCVWVRGTEQFIKSRVLRRYDQLFSTWLYSIFSDMSKNSSFIYYCQTNNEDYNHSNY